MYSASMNVTGVALAVVASMILGAVWYSPFVLGRQWMNAAGVHPKMKNGLTPAQAMSLCFVLTVALCVIVDGFLKHTTADTFAEGAKLSLWYWAVAMLVYAIHAMFEARPLKLFVISAMHQFLNFVLIGGILAAARHMTVFA